MADTGMQRLNMVESQVRPSDITDRRLMHILQTLPRELFVPDWSRAITYADEDVPVSRAQPGRPARYLLAPRTLARLVQAAEVSAGDRVLDIGCGTGYATAVLAALAGSATGLDDDPALTAAAIAAHKAANVGQVQVHQGPHARGWSTAAPYDVVFLNGSVPAVPAGLLEQLADGGRLVAVVTADGAAGARDFGVARVYLKHGSHIGVRTMFDAGAPRLPGFETAAGFAF